MPSSHYYGETEAPRGRSPLRLVIVLFFVVVFIIAGVCGALIVNPALAYLLPGASAGRVHELAQSMQGSVTTLFSDSGSLGGLRRFAEPYLSGLGLNVETVLVGLGLLLLVILCIWVLSATSRSRDEQYDEQDLFPPHGPEVPGAPLHDPYWPYDRRGHAGATGAGVAAPPPVSASMPTVGPGSGVSFPTAATGDAWPVMPAEVRSPREQALPQGPQPSHPSLYGAPASAEAAAAVEPVFADSPARPATEDYLEDMPAPAYVRQPAPLETAPVVQGPWSQPLVSAPPHHGQPPVSQHVQPQLILLRPGLGAGFKRFILPGFLLLVIGVGTAYGLTTPYAAFVTALPYAEMALYGAAGVLGLLVAIWFAAGPMKPVATAGSAATNQPQAASFRTAQPGRLDPRTGLPIPPGASVSGVRPVQAIPTVAPVAARPALQGGLEPPDASDWGAFHKPSVFLPWSQNGTSVGLDIGSAWTKVVQVARGRFGLPEMINLGLCPTPEGTISEGGIVDPEAVGTVIKRLLEGRNIIQRQATAALGGQGVIIRHVQFPEMDFEELREVIRWEAEHHIPIPPSDAIVDFTVIPGQGDPDERGHDQMRVMLVGAQRKVVEGHVAAMKRARLIPRALDLDALACLRVAGAAGHRPEEAARYAQAIMDFGHSTTKVSIYLRGALEMSRTLGVGGAAFTRVLSEQLQVPLAEAETLKRQYGVRPEGGRVFQVLGGTLQDLLFEVRRSFEFFSSRHFGQSVRQVFLVGGGARMPGIVDALTRYLNPALRERVPEGADTGIEIIDPLSAVRLHPKLAPQADLVGPEFILALGLALSAIEEEVTHAG